MIGLRAMKHDEGRQFLMLARASRLAQAKDEDYRRVMREESVLLGVK